MKTISIWRRLNNFFARSRSTRRLRAYITLGVYLIVFFQTLRVLDIFMEENSRRLPCEYDDSPNLRVIVITADRPNSLQVLLTTLQMLKMDGDTATLEIWVDRNKKGNVSEQTLSVARNFRWIHGECRVHVQGSHAGLYGQWLNTWCPQEDASEIALILEDDMSVSPYAYRWLKGAHAHYGGRSDIAGYSLQSDNVIRAEGKDMLPRPVRGVAFLYKMPGSWGYAPHPKVWSDFRRWYSLVSRDKNFHPYVEGLRLTAWYKDFEKAGTADGMWTMWFTYYCHQENLFTVYNNIMRVFKLPKGFLIEHRREKGLHFQGIGIKATHLLRQWNDQYLHFSRITPAFEFNGKSPSFST